MSLRFFIAFFFISLKAFANEPEMKVQILSFGGNSYWQAHETILEPGSDGRYKFLEGKSAHKANMGIAKCKDFLSDFQARPLSVMRESGYISEATFNELSKIRGKFDARQLLLITLFSDMPLAQAKEYIKDEKALDGRIMTRIIPNKRGWVRVSRGTIAAFRGQIFDTKKSGPLKLESGKVPWQLDNLKDLGLETELDRTNIKALVEVSRFHVEEDGLTGSVQLLTDTLFHTLDSEFRILGVPNTEVVVTGHGLDPEHTRGFARVKRRPMRILTPDRQRALETDPVGTLANYINDPLPQTTEEWAQYGNTVTYGSLNLLVKGATPLEKFSETAWQIQERTKGRLSPVQGLQIMSDFISYMRQDYNYTYPGYGQSPAPLMVRDRGSNLTAAKMVKFFESYGIPYKTEDFYKVRSWLESVQIPLEPDVFAEAWTDETVVMRKGDPRNANNFTPSFEIGNLDPKAVEKFPLSYIASVILSFADLISHEISEAPQPMYSSILEWMNVARKEYKLAPVTKVDLAAVLEVFPISVIAGNKEMAEQMRIIRGKETVAPGAGLLLSSDHNSLRAQIMVKESLIFDFRMKEIVELQNAFPGLATNAMKRLDQVKTPFD